MKPRKIIVGLILCAAGSGMALDSQQVFLFPTADTTLAEISPDNNFGAADFINAGTAGNGHNNRALLKFDISQAIPPGAQIEAVSLLLDVVREPRTGGVPSRFGLHRVLVDWGEGTGRPDPFNPGLGVPAQTGEATWNDRFAGQSQPWSRGGGAPDVDYKSVSSAALFIYGTGDSPYLFESTPDLVADVEFWLEHPSSNFGWMLISEGEGIPYTARGFASRENLTPPQLLIRYAVVPEPLGRALFMVGLAIWIAGSRRLCAQRSSRTP